MYSELWTEEAPSARVRCAWGKVQGNVSNDVKGSFLQSDRKGRVLVRVQFMNSEIEYASEMEDVKDLKKMD